MFHVKCHFFDEVNSLQQTKELNGARMDKAGHMLLVKSLKSFIEMSYSL